jgi:hypothetical protein
VVCTVGPSVNLKPKFFLPKPIYLNFLWENLIKIQYLPHLKCKKYEIPFIKSYSSRAFQSYQEHRVRQDCLGDLTLKNKTNKVPSVIHR